tara:strand:+ start:341 stop:1237 length:897 start_codon:yes stop_codon:yes gene_type:complete
MSYIGKQPRKAALTASDIEDGIITAAKIEDGAVVAAEIASNAVTTAKINADAVTGAKIADDAINSEHYTDGSVDTAHIADSNVTSAKIAADAITAAKIADDAISDEHLDVTAITGQTAETSVADGDTILIHDASASALKKMTKANFVSGVGGDNTPSFGATLSADQNNLSSGVFTLAAFNTEVWDTDSAYTNTSTYKFTVPSGEGGKYFITAHLMFRADQPYGAKTIRLYKNDNFLAESEDYYDGYTLVGNQSNTVSITTVQNLSANDYIQVYGKATGQTWDIKSEGGYFSMHKLIGV